MITPSGIAKKAVAQAMPASEYNFSNQKRESDGPEPISYSFNSMQTYSYTGVPNDSAGDNWD
jgi:hypothetical protein